MALDQTALAAPAARTSVRGALADDIAKNHTAIGAHVNGRIVDPHTRHTPFLCDDLARIRLARTSDPDGPSIVRRSTAHVMADAARLRSPGAKETIGPAVERAEGSDAVSRSLDLDKDLGAAPLQELACRRAAESKRPGLAVSASGS